MQGSSVHLDYRCYRMARLLSECLNLGELVLFSVGSLPKEEHQVAQAVESSGGDPLQLLEGISAEKI